ncbi:hypothetical protein ZIOFF_057140 [Zingiber officinale]|uniref:Uncharacterized protein n=1 Tax=Zingiber officinale TaxID=94328 RepID=A0A8J5KBK3_ZINOF|nr:hypothetical protein ZIOFF_057140 [Zingiber officinale]
MKLSHFPTSLAALLTAALILSPPAWIRLSEASLLHLRGRSSHRASRPAAFHPPPPPPPEEEEIDPRYGVEKRLVPTGIGYT